MSAGNSAYSPLPQSNSDSDCSSEEELHVSQGNRIVSRAAKVQNSKGEEGSNDQKNNFFNYKLLDNDGEVGVALNKFLTAPNEVSILKPDNGIEIFSTSRKICFVLSLLLCVFTTVAFIWILPCNLETCISASDLKNYNFTWEENLTNLEIYGPITLVSDGEGRRNLLFLTRRNLDHEKNYSENALRCLKGRDGSFKWNIKFDEEPTDVDCKLIDVNADGVHDCLIQGRNILGTIDPVSGKKLWDIQKSNKKEEKLYFRDFPLVVSDLDNDGVKDLLLPCSFFAGEKENHPQVDGENYLVIISGKTGKIINKPLQIKSCSSVNNLMFENSSVLSFTCFNLDDKESYQKINFFDLYRTLNNIPKENINFPKQDIIKQHIKDSNSVDVNGFRLILENQGDCLKDCDVLVYIKDMHESSNNKTVYHFKKKNTFGMAPVVLKSEREIGFILKFWQWNSIVEEPRLRKNVASFKSNVKSLRKRSKKVNHLLNSSRILDEEMLLESEWESQRKKRTATKLLRKRFGKNGFISEVFSLNMISETIVKIALNQSQFHDSNITKDEIIQICKKPHICQPNAHQQRHSVLVASIEEGGVEKLITFTSKYIHEGKENTGNLENWQLQSRIRVLNI